MHRISLICLKATLSFFFCFVYSDSLHAEPISVKTAVKNVLEGNHDIKAVAARIESARASIREAESSFYPSIGIAESFSRTNNPPMAFYSILAQKSLAGAMPSPSAGSSGGADPFAAFNNPPETNNWKTELNINLPVFRGGRNIAERSRAEALFQSNEANEDVLKNDLAFEAVRIYIEILKTQKLETLEKEELERVKGVLAVAESRYKNGVTLLSDVLRLKTEISRIEERILIAENQTELNKVFFNEIMGIAGISSMEPENRLPASWIDKTINTTIDTTIDKTINKTINKTLDKNMEVEELKNKALLNRAELKDAEFRIQSLSYMVSSEKASNYPWIDSFFTYELDGHEPDTGQNSWIAGVKLSYNLFDGFRTKALVFKADQNLNEAKEIKDKISLEVQKQVYSAFLKKNAAAARMSVLENSVNEAAESLRIYEKRYGEGMALVSELISAQTALSEQKGRLAMALYDYYLSSADVYHACGTLINEINISDLTDVEVTSGQALFIFK